ncbi:hypothetical protein B0H13DRAFT_2367628 [Mycena leptocephala]|nr:hypothetical protein B0H13DRAFT_2367628 [Mycena leptocephala]
MPPHRSTDSFDEILAYTAVVANALQDVATATQIPFLDSVSTLSLSVIPIVQHTKFQKDRCLRMLEEIHRMLCTLTSLCIHSEDIRSPEMLNHIAQYAITLQKFHSCLVSQRELGTIKRLFKQSEITAQLDACEGELRRASEMFMLKYGVGIVGALLELNIDTERRHQELLELISSCSQSNDTGHSIRSSWNTSTSSLSLLPASPQIFHGRESELRDLVDTLLADAARVAILGPGGIGKTTLAMAALHHSTIMDKYYLRHFISCESANTGDDLVNKIELSGSLPLAAENTALLSDGDDKRSNLEKSILLSLGSPRIVMSPHAKDLLALLSLLPDGIRAEDIIAGEVPLRDVRQGQSVLVRTSLAYIDIKGRLKVLSPIREFIRRVYPPPPTLSMPLRTYFEGLLELWESKPQLRSGNLVPELVSYLGNINELILDGLSRGEMADWVGIGDTIISLDRFSAMMLNGHSSLMQRLPEVIEATGDARLRWRYASVMLEHLRPEDPEGMIQDGVQYFGAGAQAPNQAFTFYRAAAVHYYRPGSCRDLKATEFTKLALEVAQHTGDIEIQLSCLRFEFQIAYAFENPYRAIELLHKAREFSRFTSNSIQHEC